MQMGYSSNQLWLEITAVTNGQAHFVIHTPSAAPYDLFLTTNLSSDVPGLNFTNWLCAEAVSAGQTNFSTPVGTNPIAFYRLGTTNDTDGDGLTDAFEKLVYHTETDAADTDGDALTDGQEVLVQGLDPLDPDTDDDGVIDQAFSVRITRPRGTGPLL